MCLCQMALCTAQCAGEMVRWCGGDDEMVMVMVRWLCAGGEIYQIFASAA